MVLSKPVIAAVSGYAVAGGMELALMCDLRVVEKDAIMGIFCRRFGKLLHSRQPTSHSFLLVAFPQSYATLVK
jgi:hypothetical protein